MEFCPTCANLLLIENARMGKPLRFFCPTCPYIFPIERKVSKNCGHALFVVSHLLFWSDARTHTVCCGRVHKKILSCKNIFLQRSLGAADLQETGPETEGSHRCIGRWRCLEECGPNRRCVTFVVLLLLHHRYLPSFLTVLWLLSLAFFINSAGGLLKELKPWAPIFTQKNKLHSTRLFRV